MSIITSMIWAIQIYVHSVYLMHTKPEEITLDLFVQDETASDCSPIQSPARQWYLGQKQMNQAHRMLSSCKFRILGINTNTIHNTNCIVLFHPYSEEGEVPTAVDACDLKVAHYDFTVLVVLPQGAVLLLQVRQRAQLVLCSSTY